MPKNPHAVALGKLGGKASAQWGTPELRSERARKAGKAPKKKRSKSPTIPTSPDGQ